MSSENTGARGNPRSSNANVLVISGVNISRPISAEDIVSPEKDYKVLIDAIRLSGSDMLMSFTEGR